MAGSTAWRLRSQPFCCVTQALELAPVDDHMNVRIQTQEQVALAAQALEEQASHVANVTYTPPNEDGSASQETNPTSVAQAVLKVGHNDHCPCGSGKKYKACHGKLA